MRAAPEARFHPGHALLVWIGATALTVVAGSAILGATGNAGRPQESLDLWVRLLLQVPLWAGLLAGLAVVSRRTGTGSFRRDYGLEFRWSDALVGVPIGVVTQLVFGKLLYTVLGWFFDIDQDAVSQPARELTERASGAGIVLLVLLVVVGAPLVEELFYRGLLLRSIQYRVNDGVAIVASAVLFGLVHFQWLQLPALVLIGLVLAVLAQRTGRLGMAIFAHAGFNAASVVVLLSASGS